MFRLVEMENTFSIGIHWQIGWYIFYRNKLVGIHVSIYATGWYIFWVLFGILVILESWCRQATCHTRDTGIQTHEIFEGLMMWKIVGSEHMSFESLDTLNFWGLRFQNYIWLKFSKRINGCQIQTSLRASGTVPK